MFMPSHERTLLLPTKHSHIKTSLLSRSATVHEAEVGRLSRLPGSFSTVCHECCRFQRLTPSVVTSCCRDVTARGGQGYALRELKDDFMKKYKVLHPNADDLESLVAYLSTMLGASSRDWQIGTSKVRGHHTSYANMGCEIAAVEEALMFSCG